MHLLDGHPLAIALAAALLDNSRSLADVHALLVSSVQRSTPQTVAGVAAVMRPPCSM